VSISRIIVALAGATVMWAQPKEPAIQGKIDVPKALKLLYGNYDAKAGSSAGKDGLLVTEYAVMDVVEEGKTRWILYTTANAPSNTCHGCNVALGVAMFEKQGDLWILKTENKELSHIGSYGVAGDCKKVKWGTNSYGLLVDGGWTGYGNMTSWQTLFAYDKGAFRAIFGLTTSDTNAFSLEPDKDKYGWEITWAFDKPAPNGIFDIVVKEKAPSSYPTAAHHKKSGSRPGVYRYDGKDYWRLQQRVKLGS
jgi:hypothetical protein